MLYEQMEKVLLPTPPAAIIDDSAVTVAEIDTLGFDRLTIYVILGATDIGITVCKLTESDSAGSGHADISGADFDGGTDIDGSADALPAATDDNKIFVFDVDLKKRKRYIDMGLTVGDGTTGAYVCVMARLTRGVEAPVAVANMGAIVGRIAV